MEKVRPEILKIRPSCISVETENEDATFNLTEGQVDLNNSKIIKRQRLLQWRQSDSRLAKSDSCLFLKRSRFNSALKIYPLKNLRNYCRWKVVKNSLDFIKKSKQLIGTTVPDSHQDIHDILNEQMREEILRVMGSEFDLYLRGLFYRDFDAGTINF